MARTSNPKPPLKPGDGPVRVWVTGVPDGDSLRVAQSPKYGASTMEVRLFGIDAPEKNQAYGDNARDALLDLVNRNKAGLLMEVVDIDHHNRLVGLLYSPKADRYDSINRQMVEQGHALWYRQFGGKALGLADAEKSAKERRRGLWRKGLRLAPWEHRGAERRAARRWARRRLWLLTVALIVLVAFLWQPLLGVVESLAEIVRNTIEALSGPGSILPR